MIKNLNKIDSLSKEEIIKMILIMFYSFKSYDLVDYLISEMDKRFDSNFLEQYRKMSSSFKILKKY